MINKAKDRNYDYIIVGSGCAGLSLAMQMMSTGLSQNKRILLIDQDQKETNDRTWSFWESGINWYEIIVSKQWKTLWFHSHQASRKLNIHPYSYKTIRSIDYYTYCKDHLGKLSNFEFIVAEAKQIDPSGEVKLANGECLRGEKVFSSIPRKLEPMKRGEHRLLQHFIGWEVEMEEAVFDEKEAVLMDFRLANYRDTVFVYVLPYTPNTALIEFTVFSEDLWDDQKYVTGIESYITQYYPGTVYSVLHQEKGVIPMNNGLKPMIEKKLVHIGIPGGMVKPSSGYAFRFIQKQVKLLVEQLQQKDQIDVGAFISKKHHFYDSVLLYILRYHKLPPDEIFTPLFLKNDAVQLFKFLDNESNLLEDMRIMKSLPLIPFFKAACKTL